LTEKPEPKPKDDNKKKREMTITMKSESLKPGSGGLARHLKEPVKRKQRDFRKKGTRGASWIG
jgi:hypothetical protein